MPWIQNYYVIADNIFLTALFAMLPIFFLFWALAIRKIKGYLAVAGTWCITFLVSVSIFRMPVSIALSAALFGAINGFFPLCWLILNAVFFHNLIAASGKFEIIKSSIASISNDRRVQAILIGFCFSAFLEGVSGIATPVAISATILIGLGFPVLPAAVICLIGNTVPVPFGAIGLPTIITVTTAFGADPQALSAVTGSVGIVMSTFALILPVFILFVMCGRKATLQALPVCLAGSIGYIAPNFLITAFIGPQLPSVISPLVSMGVIIFFLRIWKPKTIWRFNDDIPVPANREKYPVPQIIFAWTPFIMLTLLIMIWSLPAFSAFSAALPLRLIIEQWPGLSGLVYLNTPIVPVPAPFDASFSFDFFAASGTALLISSILCSIIFRIKFFQFFKIAGASFLQLKFALLSMTLVLSIAHLSNYSGISYTLGLAFAATGPLFLFFSPLIGFTGVFLTGSVSSSGALFGNLQRVTAEQLGLSPLITVTANITGAVMGKLVSPTSLAIVAASVGLTGKEGLILGKTMKHALVLLGMSIAIIYLSHIFL
ncbi:MAG: L-lactate permease [Treponema sp.]|nr:L-lactate permease [Treponema sp.]